MGIDRSRSRGFVLIAALILVALMSALALALMYSVNTEVASGGNDRQNNLAYHGAEGGMEKMTADMQALYQAVESPTQANLTSLANNPPAIPNINYLQTAQFRLNPDGSIQSRNGIISTGPNAGLQASIVPVDLTSIAQMKGRNEQVKMLRTVEVALIPVFQFGVFSEGDLAFHPGPAFDFAGRIHTNGNLFLADGTKLTFHSKITAVSEVIRTNLPNGLAASSGWSGPVYIPTAPAGCDTAAPSTNCQNLTLNPDDGSLLGGPGSGPNPSWKGISVNTFHGWIRNGTTGAKPLTLPFVGNGIGPVQIIRRPPPGELAGSMLATSRLYNQAQIRILLSDTWQENHPDKTNPVQDAGDVALTDPAGINPLAIPFSVAGVAGNSYFGWATTSCVNHQEGCEGIRNNPNVSDFVNNPPTADQPLVTGWLRVEYMNAAGIYVPVTQEWLGYGFARDPLPPMPFNNHTNSVHPQAILLFQQQADRNADGVISGTAVKGQNVSPTPSNYTEMESQNLNSPYTWFPINFYDPREGESRDTSITKAAGSCTPEGVMSAVELDVNNLRQWLLGNFGGSGSLVNTTAQNGYVLYFSDRRGMQLDPTTSSPPIKTGKSGLEDVVNIPVANGNPDGHLDPAEDVDGNGQLDMWGATSVIQGFEQVVPGNPSPYNGLGLAPGTSAGGNVFSRITNCAAVARKNRVTGARHVLRLVDGARNTGSTGGRLPTLPNGTGGFTVASENPTYVLGDYNANSADNSFADPHAAAAIIADAITVLSNDWNDTAAWVDPSNLGYRVVKNTAWYRFAMAAGKNIYFPYPSWANSTDDGTDGGVHNFIRYIENWGGQTLNYQGSLVSFYFSQYATGRFKCCSLVYKPPTRAYSFDTKFLDPTQLPPGTPMFRDIDNVNYRQDFTPY